MARSRRMPIMAVLASLACAAVGVRHCRSASSAGRKNPSSATATASKKVPATPSPSAEPSSRAEVPFDGVVASGPHPRLLLTPERLARVQRNRALHTPAWAALLAACEEARAKPRPSGYEAWDWGNWVADCALLWRATSDERHARTAIEYLTALVDDRQTIGDGAGGDRAARHDHGYAIRTYGFFSALGYDWLHDAPGMTEALRARVRGRLNGWLEWYGREGYRRDDPISNYFMGYFATLAYTSFATAGENEKDWTPKLQRLFSTRVAPSFAKLSGGDWPEGWQYGDNVATMMAFFVDGERTARGKDRLAEVPWLSSVVAHHTHALMPDGRSTYDNGDWTNRPARLSSHALDALSFVLPVSDLRASQARRLARELRDRRDNWKWLVPIADEPAAPTDDPRKGALSYFAPGTGLVFARSGWGGDATFVSLQSGPVFEDADHQHHDQGHFELVRGSDELFIDPGEYRSFATINHNSLLIDDHRDALDYCPNQGAWGKDPRIARFVDGGEFVYAQADFGDAYRPSKLADGVKRSVLAVTRDWVYLRPSTLILRDRVVVAKPDYEVVWIGHVPTPPEVSGATVVTRMGGSQADLTVLLPQGAEPRVQEEPTNDLDSVHMTNRTYRRSYRIEVRGAKDREVHFLHVLRAKAAGEGRGAANPPRLASDAEGADVVLLRAEHAGGPTAVVIAHSGSHRLHYVAPAGVQHLLVGLRPDESYRVRAELLQSGCGVIVEPGRGVHTDDAGTLSMRMDDCAPK